MTGVGVLGGSNLGYCYAADLARRERDTTLWVRTPEHHDSILAAEELHLVGVAGEHAAAVEATTDLDRALRHDLLLAAIPSWGYPELVETLRGRLEPRHHLLLTPGNAGAVTFASAVQAGSVGETAHPLFGARRAGPARVDMVARATELPLGALPSERTDEVVERWNAAVGEDVFRAADSVLDAALNNPNPIFHTVPCVLNVGYLEGVDTFHLYRDGMSAAVHRALYRADDERIALRECLGYGPPHYPQWTILEPERDPEEPALFESETFRHAATSPEYHGPHSLDHRFIDEDTSNLVLWTDLAQVADTHASVMDAVVALFTAASGRDYPSRGRTLATVGLPQDGIDSVLEAVS